MTADTETIREKERATMKAMTAELADYAEKGGMSSVDADQLRAQILGIYEAALAALGRVEERERALTEALERFIGVWFEGPDCDEEMDAAAAEAMTAMDTKLRLSSAAGSGEE